MTLTAQYRPYRDEDISDGLDNEHMAWSDHEPGTIQIYEKTTEDIPFTSNRRLLLGVVLLSVLTLLTGFLIGYFAHSTHSECVQNLALSLHSVRDEDPTIRARILKNVDTERIKDDIILVSGRDHRAGSPNDLKLATHVKKIMSDHNFDKVEFKNYSVLLSMPDPNQPNYFEIIDEMNNKTIYTSLKPSEGTDTMSPFSAYSPKIDLRSSVIYVNFGRLSDYKLLQSPHYNITRDKIAGKILIAKQFHLAADEQMNLATQMGAEALLLYPDPEHYNPPELNAKPFPASPYMPSDAIRHDSLIWNGLGDPQTPGYPATPYAHRLPLKSLQLPSIAVQPISYSMAYEILSRLGGSRAPTPWNGGFNFTHNLGPGFRNEPNTNLTLNLKINNQLVNKTIYNVIGSIRGRVEPDRYVIIGNHRDSWFQGAVDSSAGTAAFLEVARVFGDLVKEGWRPRRSILMCSWGAEEFNLIGSTEWIEENQKILDGRAVAYVNSDIIVLGNGSLSVAASPLLYHAIFNATKEVPNPNEEEDTKTVYDKWLISFTKMRNTSELAVNKNSLDLEELKSDESKGSVSLLSTYLESAMLQTRPHVPQLDMRSAYAPFFTSAGIPAIDMTYITVNNVNNDSNQINSMSYPLLHTQYDRIELIQRFIDPDFKYHKAVTQVLAEILRDLSDSLFIPFNLIDYAQVLKDLFSALQTNTYPVLKNNGIDSELLKSAIERFTRAALLFHSKQDKLDFTDPMAIRQVNDQLLLIERTFLDQNGLPRNANKRHIVMSPSETDPSYDPMFPGLMDEFSFIINQAEGHKNITTGVKSSWSWDVIKAHFSILVFTIESATKAISDVI